SRDEVHARVVRHVRPLGGQQVVHDDHLARIAMQQRAHEVAADEAGAADDQDFAISEALHGSASFYAACFFAGVSTGLKCVNVCWIGWAWYHFIARSTPTFSGVLAFHAKSVSVRAGSSRIVYASSAARGRTSTGLPRVMFMAAIVASNSSLIA